MDRAWIAEGHADEADAARMPAGVGGARVERWDYCCSLVVP